MKRSIQNPQRHGQSLVEMAFCLPILMMLLCGIIEMGFLFYNTLRLQDGVREAVRQGARAGNALDCADLRDLVRQYRPVLGMNGLSVRITVCDSAGVVQGTWDEGTATGTPERRQAGDQLEVRATCAVDWLTPLSVLLNLVPVPVRVDQHCVVNPSL